MYKNAAGQGRGWSIETIHIRVNGDHGKVDGHLEVILGTFVVGGLLVERSAVQVRKAGLKGEYLYVTLKVKSPPLGHLGTSDCVAYTGDEK